MSKNTIIKLENVTKKYNIIEKREGLKGNIIDLFFPKKRCVTAINNISFSISEGETLGYIGENGAGKSTTIKMICGVLKSNSGTIWVNGKDINKYKKSDYKNLGVVFGQKSQLWWDLAVIESLKLLAEIYDINHTEFENRLNILKQYLEIENLLNKPVRKLSLGQRVLCDFAAIYIYKPKIVILDEPTIGIDVSIKQKIRNFIKYMNNEGITFLLTTHDLNEIEELCSRVVVLNKGELIFDGNIVELKKCSDSIGELRIDFTFNISQDELQECICDEAVSINKISEKTYLLNFDKTKVKYNVLISKLTHKYEILDLRMLDVSIDKIVQRIYEGSV